MSQNKLMTAAVFTMLSKGLLAAGVPVLPVSDACNPMCLKGMADKPWWNDAWRQRLAGQVPRDHPQRLLIHMKGDDLSRKLCGRNKLLFLTDNFRMK